jgi:hypothetical protein
LRPFWGRLSFVLAGVLGLQTPASAAPGTRAPERRLTLFYTGAVHGTLEPCGCTSDPLGGVDRYAALVNRQRKLGPTLIVDAGNLLFPLGGLAGPKREAGGLRARFLAAELGKLGLAGAGLGPSDLAAGAEAVVPKRLAANLAGHAIVAPSEVRQVGAIRVGLMGIADPAVLKDYDLRASDPVEAAAREAASLRQKGAELVVAVAAVNRPLGRKIARAAAIDFMVLGREIGEGLPRADKVDDTYLLAAGEEMQRVGRVDVVLRGERDGKTPLEDAGGPEALALRLAEIDGRLASLDAQLAGWHAQPGTADAAFVAGRRAERQALADERATVVKQGWRPPASGAYFTNQLIPLRGALGTDAGVRRAMRTLDKAVGKVNLAHTEPPSPAPAGRAHFTGDRACAGCHKEETRFWKTTIHAKAWTTLVKGGKTLDLECVSCHVTGYGELGGSNLGHTKNLEAVQCETCHGPGSVHVAEEGLEDPPAVRLATPESTCVQCHNEKHSDTFNFVAYLRDILGPGHGEAARKALGPGPTGAELRHTAIAKAKAAGAAQRKRQM